MPIATTDPRTGSVVRTYQALSRAELEQALALAEQTARSYPRTTYAQRAQWLRQAADLFDAEAEQLGELLTLEMGKTLASATAEVRKCATGMRYYAEHAESFLAPSSIDPESVNASQAYTVYQPLGVVLAIMPWNFPLWQAVRFAAPALMAGNVGLLKHASNVPGSALALAEILGRAGFPAGAFQTLLIGSDQVASVIEDRRVAAVTLTGSEGAGRAVGETAGRALKKVVLELGGSDAFVVMPSADLSAAATTAVKARCQNNGQSCIAAKRFIVHAEVYDVWLEKFVAEMAALKLGDPMDPDTDLGPLATEQGVEEVAEQVADAVRHGAHAVLGGRRSDGPGWYYPATVLTGISPDNPIYGEEVFGPVALVFKVESLEEAIALANDTRFGLGSNAWTNDDAEQAAFVDGLQAGQTFINGMTISYPELPFGGVKASGHGRELAAAGIREFTNLKTVWVG